ncbi:FusB/FusC family EF-G-binding protein [Gorillibacterium timonense]|uniref:FusB/FusC family EF-G-binding protein n=1 Tax=Gorillibacterium timonense TaxID=1689269 RepID=UPI00071C7B43|nr:FusB/FusC family EF-G-binding protein [Gorillibacterium timonense]
MCEPFLYNHQYNALRKQVTALHRACSTVSDPKVVESVRLGAMAWVREAFPEATDEQLPLLNAFTDMTQSEQFQQYLLTLEAYRATDLQATEKQISKLYPKIKKLKVPDLSLIDTRKLTYLGWIDIAANRMFMVYRWNGELVGIEGRYTPANKGVCFLCNRIENVALFSTVAKYRPPGSSPDYYKAIGQYMCLDHDVCNHNITDVAPLERFLKEALKPQ